MRRYCPPKSWHENCLFTGYSSPIFLSVSLPRNQRTVVTCISEGRCMIPFPLPSAEKFHRRQGDCLLFSTKTRAHNPPLRVGFSDTRRGGTGGISKTFSGSQGFRFKLEALSEPYLEEKLSTSLSLMSHPAGMLVTFHNK